MARTSLALGIASNQENPCFSLYWDPSLSAEIGIYTEPISLLNSRSKPEPLSMIMGMRCTSGACLLGKKNNQFFPHDSGRNAGNDILKLFQTVSGIPKERAKVEKVPSLNARMTDRTG